jgi:HD-like signal output (HDOD) protein
MDREQRQLGDLWSNSKELELAVMERLEQGTLRVPPYPSVALALRKLVAQENYGLDEVLTIVSNDPALVADVLRCANSAFFGRGSISSLRQAVGRIGAQQIMRLALVSGLSGIVRAAGPLAPLRRQAWEMSLSSAAICQRLAIQRKLPDESAFIAGLLHNFGWLIAIGTIEEMLLRDPEAPPRSEAFWATVIENCHTRLGLALAARWNLPALLLDTIALHHQLDEPSEFAPFIELVAISDRINDLLLDHPLVSAEQLSVIPELTDREREALARMLPTIPELISAFASDQPNGPSESKLLAPQNGMLDGFQPASLAVTKLGTRKSGPFKLVGIGPNGWVMRGTEPLLEKQLVEMEIAAKPMPIRLWAKVDLCVSGETSGWEFECKPFALSQTSLQQWNELVRTHE